MNVYDISDKTISFHLPEPLFSVRSGRGEDAIEFLELFSGFDIETTNIFQLDIGWAAYAYHMQLSIYNQREQNIYLFRSWDLVLWFFDHISEVYDLGENRRLIVWIANFSFEFQFLKDRLEWSEGEYDFFAKEERQPLKATYKGIEFHEALAISGGNLAYLADTYCTTKKLVGDLDYDIERNSHTPLTDQELQYCINDVAILAEFSQTMFNDYIREKKKVPLTRTAMLIDEFKDLFRQLCKDRDKRLKLPPYTTELEYRDYLKACFPDFETYQLWFNWLFRGGYVHANALFCDIDVYVKMRDITSHYPTRMSLSYCPGTPFRSADPSTLEDAIKDKCCIIHAAFWNIETTTPHSIESRNKIPIVLDAQWDNGRLVKASYMEVYLTEFDFKIYKMFYKWSDMDVISLKTSKRRKYPDYVIRILHKHYIHKNDLKRQGLSESQDYAVTKVVVNTHFGALCKRIKLDKIVYKDREWTHDTVTPDFQKERDKTILLPQWGIWVTAAARYELLHTLYKLTISGVDVVYMDTDSIKYRPSHIAENIFQRYNNKIARRLRNRHLRNPAFSDLGFFDKEEVDKATKEHKVVRFKTLGAKRYIYDNGQKIKATIAGLPKQSIKALGSTPDEIFNNFTSLGFRVEPEESGKLTTKYQDEPHHANVAGETMEELSSVALYKIKFTLTLADDFIHYIEAKKEERPNL